MNFSIGVLNGTQNYNITTFQVCREVIDNQWVNETMCAINDFMALSLFDGFYNVWDIMYASDTVAHSCYAGMEELVMQAYNETMMMDPNGTL